MKRRANGHIVRLLLLLLFIVIAGYTFAPYLGDVASLYQRRESLSLWWIAFAALAQIVQYAAEGYFIRILLRFIHFDIDLKDTIRVAALDVFATHVLPLGQFGSFAANIYFYRKLGVGPQGIVLLDLALGVLGALILFFLLVVTAFLMPSGTFAVPLTSYLLVLFAILTLGILFAVVAARSKAVGDVVSHLITDWPRLAGIVVWIRKAGAYARLLAKQGWAMTRVVILKDALYDLIDVTALECCFLAFHVSLPITLVVFAYVVSLVAGYATLTPEGLGASDAALGVIFLSAKVNPAVVVGVVVLSRVVNTVLPLLMGAYAYYSLRREIDVDSR